MAATSVTRIKVEPQSCANAAPSTAPLSNNKPVKTHLGSRPSRLFTTSVISSKDTP